MKQIVRLFLAGLLVYLMVTVAAFVYLEWWQAIAASMLTFVVLVQGAKFLIRYAIRRVTGGFDLSQGIEGFAVNMIRTKSQVLRGASADIHSVRPIAEPPEMTDDEVEPDEDMIDSERVQIPMNWYEVDVSIYPPTNPNGPMTHWNVDDLILIPFDVDVSEDMESLQSSEQFGMVNLMTVENGEARDLDDGQVTGPLRFRFDIAIPRGIREVKFRYFFESFGRIRLPDPRLPAGRTSSES